MEGLYEISGLEPGTYSVIISFIGYETLEVPNIIVETGKVTEVNIGLGASSVSLDEVVVTTTISRESEVALLLEQKKAIEIKESIGAQQLTKLAVSDAATATTKISGVTKNEGSGDVFIRGLGEITINRDEYKILKGEEEIILPRKEFELLSLLASRPSKVFKREDILDKVWGNEVVVGGRTIDVHIRKLREKLGDDHFKTVKGVGYKFVL